MEIDNIMKSGQSRDNDYQESAGFLHFIVKWYKRALDKISMVVR